MYRIGYCEFSRQNPDRDVIYRPAGRTDYQTGDAFDGYHILR